MLKQIKDNYVSWLLGLLLTAGIGWHEFKTQRLHQQIAALQVETEINKAQAGSLEDRVPEMLAQVNQLKQMIELMKAESLVLRESITAAQTPADGDSRNEIERYLDLKKSEKQAKEMETKLTETAQNVAFIESNLGKWAKEVSSFQGKTALARGEVPAGAEALCADGSYSMAGSRKNACSERGGVAKWLR
jgi:chromosome segregation ATPase